MAQSSDLTNEPNCMFGDDHCLTNLQPPDNWSSGAKQNDASIMASAQWKGENVQKKTGAGAPRKASHRPKHNHSKIATDLFKEWFYANMQHPFPSDEVKAEFADRTGLSFTQVATWFINARKRVWKPLIHQDASHDELTGVATMRSATRTQERYGVASSDSHSSTCTTDYADSQNDEGECESVQCCDDIGSAVQNNVMMIDHHHSTPPPPPAELPVPLAPAHLAGGYAPEVGVAHIISPWLSPANKVCNVHVDDQFQGLALFSTVFPTTTTTSTCLSPMCIYTPPPRVQRLTHLQTFSCTEAHDVNIPVDPLGGGSVRGSADKTSGVFCTFSEFAQTFALSKHIVSESGLLILLDEGRFSSEKV